MKKKFASILAVAVLGFATAHSGVASVVSTQGAAAVGPVTDALVSPFTYSGSTVGGPTFNRPLANGNAAPTSLSGVGTAVAYDVVTFTVAVAGTYTFQSTASFDNYTFLYSGVFNPATPLTGVLIGNDDNPTIGLSGFTRALTTGTTYSFVTTGFANTDAGTFTDTITLVPVPEPGTWVMIGASFVGLAAAQRFRRRSPR